MNDKIKYIFANFRNVLPTVYTDALSYLEQLQKLYIKVNELIKQTNSFGEALQMFWKVFVTKEELQDKYKLSDKGDFTGTVANGRKTAFEVVDELKDLDDNLKNLTEQFAEGATGAVIDCGYFVDMEISRNYDGGVF